MGAVHWAVRAAQRAIPGPVIDLVMEYGKTIHDHRGGEIVYLTRKTRSRLEHAVKRSDLPRLDKLLDVYVVLGDQGIVTVGHRYRRLRRP
jgi:hypothetical protein